MYKVSLFTTVSQGPTHPSGPNVSFFLFLFFFFFFFLTPAPSLWISSFFIYFYESRRGRSFDASSLGPFQTTLKLTASLCKFSPLVYGGRSPMALRTRGMESVEIGGGYGKIVADLEDFLNFRGDEFPLHLHLRRLEGCRRISENLLLWFFHSLHRAAFFTFVPNWHSRECKTRALRNSNKTRLPDSKVPRVPRSYT